MGKGAMKTPGTPTTPMTPGTMAALSGVPNANPRSNQWRALLRKNASLQRRQKWSNCCMVIFPVCLILFAGAMQLVVNALTPPSEKHSHFRTPPMTPANYAWFNETANAHAFEGYWITYADDAVRDTVGIITQDGHAAGMLARVEQFEYTFHNGSTTGMPYFWPYASEDSMDDHLVDAWHMAGHFGKSAFTSGKAWTDLPAATAAVQRADVHTAALEYTVGVNENQFYARTYFDQQDFLQQMFWLRSRLIALIDQTFLAAVTGADAVVEVSLTPIPYKSPKNIVSITDMLSIVLLPFCLSFLFPVFLHHIVMEKETKLREMQKMMGLSMPEYWMITYVFQIGLTFFVTVAFLICEAAFQVRFLMQTNGAITFLMLFLWSNAQVAMSFFFSTFISKAKTATVLGYFLVIVGVITSFILNQAVYPPQTARYPLPWLFYPPLAFYRCITLIVVPCLDLQCMSWGEVAGSELAVCLTMLGVMTVVLLLGTAYLDQVIPSQWGVARPVLFPVYWLVDTVRGTHKGEDASSLAQPLLDIEDANPLPYEVPAGDDDVQRESEVVHAGEVDDCPVVLRDLRKEYDTHKVAVHGMSLALQEGECFGLLGPNGAGKTSLISCLCGLFPPTSGSAQVYGFDITTDIRKVQRLLGICPQFDVHWADLSCYQHLLFYTRLKGIDPAHEKAKVMKLLDDVGLSAVAHRKSKELSGGMRRRLSVAIALAGDPKILIGDECTTGLDPQSKRQLWDVLARARKGRVTILTTHSMEEADVLCTRIGIIGEGRLQCLGSQTHLKNKYGRGYRLQINFARGEMDRAAAYVERLLPSAVLSAQFHNTCTYAVPTEHVDVSAIFAQVEANKEAHGIEDWCLAQTSLDDVFMGVVHSSSTYARHSSTAAGADDE